MQPFYRQRPYAWASDNGAPQATGKLRLSPEDFVVDEILGFEPDGASGHTFVSVTKRGRNTADAAGWLASIAKVPIQDIGYCGMKDRHALTTQWFSVPDSRQVMRLESGRETNDFKIVRVENHGKKLRRGAHAGNRFAIRVRDVEQLDRHQLFERLMIISDQGFPNYFGPQRFGRSGENVRDGLEMVLRGQVPRRHGKKGILLSALRSALFNLVLDHRIKRGVWSRFVAGDVNVDSRSERDRQDRSGINGSRGQMPTGPLWGLGESPVSELAFELECEALQDAGTICRAIEAAGVRQGRRALLAFADALEWDMPDSRSLELQFSLSSGSYATALLREVIGIDGDQPPWSAKSPCSVE